MPRACRSGLTPGRCASAWPQPILKRKGNRSAGGFQRDGGWRAGWCSDNTRRFLGLHRLKWAITGAAPISPNVIRWYRALGVNLLEGYGMTESTGAGAADVTEAARLGTVGRPTSGTRIRLGEHDEIQIAGDAVFMGYLNNPEQTAQVIGADGWLHTGDVGRIDADGFISIVDHMKDIIITAGGKNITPSEFENELKFSSYISDAVVIGDQQPSSRA